MSYIYRQSGINGCELLDANGNVFAWTMDSAWAAVLIDLLNAIGGMEE